MHINVIFHFFRDLTTDGVIKLKSCNTQDQSIDIFIKSLKLNSFDRLREGLGMKYLS